MMNNPTDTNQASEADKAVMIGFLYGIQSDLLPDDEVRHRMAGFRHTQGYKDAIELIRTEKLKLLDEVIHQSTVNLKSAKAVAGWAELRKNKERLND